MRKSIAVSLVVAFAFSFYLGTVAASNLQEVIVNIDYGMKMFLHGQPFNPTDVSTGTAYRPIIYKNKIYLPAREICNASNLSIDYDSKGNILNIGERLDYIAVKSEDYKDQHGTAFTKDADLLFTPSIVFKYGIVKNPVDAMFYEYLIKPNGKYSKFAASLYLDEKCTQQMIYNFKNADTGELLKSVEVKAGEIKDIEFDVIGVKSIFVYDQEFYSPNGKVILGEPRFK